jgi:hypothetical protein
VEQAAKTIAALDVLGRHGDQVDRPIRLSLPEPLVWPDLVVVADELDEHSLQVTSTEDQ